MPLFHAVVLGAAAAVSAAPRDASFSCNVLSSPDVSCMLPWPDNFFFSRTWDSAAPPALVLTNASLPQSSEGGSIDPDLGGYNALQGFSPMGPFVALFPGISLEASRLPRLWNITDSLRRGATSVLLNTAMGRA